VFDHVLVSVSRGRDHPKTEVALSSSIENFIFASISEVISPLPPSPAVRLDELLFERGDTGFSRLQLAPQKSDAVQSLPRLLRQGFEGLDLESQLIDLGGPTGLVRFFAFFSALCSFTHRLQLALEHLGRHFLSDYGSFGASMG
jgi:hypothetical protein